MKKQEDPKKFSTPLPLYGYNDRKSADAVIEKISGIGTDIREFTFRLEHGVTFNPEPGQFITVRIDETNERFRSYSVAMPSNDPSRVIIAVKLDRDGWGSPRLFEMKEGGTVRLEGPMGDFTIGDHGRDRIFIEGGIGITPFLSLARHAAESSPENSVHVIYGANTPEDVIYRDYLDELKNKYSNFDYTITLSNPGDAWDGNRGLVTDVLERMPLEGKEAYLCGSRPMIQAVTAKLAEGGVSESSMHIEAAF
jgi:ferredoxin-NADP reductase